MSEEKYLPLGTIVLLNNGTIPVMIIGYYMDDGKGDYKDYAAVSYPEGLLTLDAVVIFDHEDIKIILNMGKKTIAHKRYNEHLLNQIKE